MILSWVLFPLVLAAIGAGWGSAVERIAATRVDDALLIPLGLAAALVVAGTLTAFTATAPAATSVVAAGALAGLVLAWPGRRLAGWPLLAAFGVLLVYGAPVLLSGQATFAGYVKLDDTSTWFNIIDNVMSHGRSVAGLAKSTYTRELEQTVRTYPLGSFMLPGVARALTGIDIAWVLQPYLAFCASALALCLCALMAPIVSHVRLRALFAFIAAQSALLYGYSLWGGIKEMTAAFLLALGAALGAAAIARRPSGSRELIPLAVAAGALIQTLGAGAAGWAAPALAFVVIAWARAAQPTPGTRASLRSVASLGGLTAAFVVPLWVVLAGFLDNRGQLIEQLFSSGQSAQVKLGSLIHPLSVFQLAGIWPVGDFRATAPTLGAVLLIGAAALAVSAGLFLSVRGRRFGLAFYVSVAVAGCVVVYLSGGTPWVVAKALAISSPALLTAALSGAGMLWAMRRPHPAIGAAGLLATVALAGGVLWSNVLAYHDVTLAPRPRLAELQHIGRLLADKGPTFFDEYEKYAERHFLRDGTPLLLGKNGVEIGDLDFFPLSKLEPYRSIVTRRSPVESRPPSIYHLAWQGRYYELWQRPAHPAMSILEHISLGEPAATAPCPELRRLSVQALREHARIVAAERPAPIVVHGDQTVWPRGWAHNASEHRLTPDAPGQAVGHIAVASSQVYELWLDGSFGRGFEVTVDGRRVGAVEHELSVLGGYAHVADISLTVGIHTFGFSYPHANLLEPGSGDENLRPSRGGVATEGFTWLGAVALQPESPPSELIELAPQDATQLCGRPLDWIELVSA